MRTRVLYLCFELVISVMLLSSLCLGQNSNVILSPGHNNSYTVYTDIPINCSLSYDSPHLLGSGMLFGSGMIQSAIIKSKADPKTYATISIINIEDQTEPSEILAMLQENTVGDVSDYKERREEHRTINNEDISIIHYVPILIANRLANKYVGGYEINKKTVLYLFSNFPPDETDIIFNSLKVEPIASNSHQLKNPKSNLTESNKTNSTYWYDLGISNLNSNDFYKALEAFDEATKLNDSYENAWLYKGYSLLQLSRYNESLRCYKKVIELDPNCTKAWVNMGVANAVLGDHQSAINAFEKATVLDSNLSDAWYNKGKSLHALGKNEEAISALERAIELEPDNLAFLLNKGISLAAKGNYNESIKIYKEIVQKDNKYIAAWFNMGNAFLNIKDYENSIKAYDKALKLNPSMTQVAYYKGLALRSRTQNFPTNPAFENAEIPGIEQSQPEIVKLGRI